jgi:hypothetical protein
MFISLLALILSLWVVYTHGAACTAEQLSSPDKRQFRITGGGGSTYQTGTQQVVSFDRPTGNKVASVQILQIVQGGLVITPVQSGTPVGFAINAPDIGGSVQLTIPNIAAGTWTYRLLLGISGDGTCTLDSQPFQVVVASAQCSTGSSQCISTEQYRTCNTGGQFDPPQTCGAGTSCVQAGSTAVCTAGSGGAPCIYGQYRCVDTKSFHICSYNSASVLAFGDTQPCGFGTRCQDIAGNSIQCVTDALVTCNENDLRCNAVSTASEKCVGGVWVADTTCDAGQVCNNGICSLSSGGGSCTPGYQRCVPNGYQVCTQKEQGWVWGDTQQCNAALACQSYLGNYIVCA